MSCWWSTMSALFSTIRILSSYPRMHSMTRRNSSEMSSLWASNNRIIRSTRSANHSTTSQKLYLHKQQDYTIHSFRQPFHHLTEIIPAQTTGLYDPLVPPTIPSPHRNYTCTNNRIIRSNSISSSGSTNLRLPPTLWSPDLSESAFKQALKLYLLNLY